jgi:predicted metal-dependent hydrolase
MGENIMLQSRRMPVLGGVVLLACFIWAACQPAVAVDRRNSRSAAARLKPQQPAAEADSAGPQDTVLGDDHQKNLETLQKEKLETLRQRVDLLTRGYSLGRVSEDQLDHATLEQLQAELETLDRPHLRIEALKKIVTLRQKFEDAAKLRVSNPAGKAAADVNAFVSAHGRYIGARLARINAQMNLERELLGQEKEKESPKSESPTEKTPAAKAPAEKPK